MTIMQSDRKYFAGGVNPHDENVFGVLIETFGTLSLNISGKYYQRTQCTDEQERQRSECADAMLIYNFACSTFLLSHVHHARLFIFWVF